MRHTGQFIPHLNISAVCGSDMDRGRRHVVPAWPTCRRSHRFNPVVTLINIINDDDGTSQHHCFLIVNNTACRHVSTSCRSLAAAIQLERAAAKLCYLIWAFCAAYAASRDLAERLCKHSVTGSTRVYLQKHQSHTEAVKENEGTDSQHSTRTTGTDLWRRFQMQSESFGNPKR